MRAKTFISLMLLMAVFTIGLMLVGATPRQQTQTECPAEQSNCTEGSQTQTTDLMLLETVSRHLLSAVQ